MHSRYGRKINVPKIGLDGTEVLKKAELHRRSPTPELHKDRFCGKFLSAKDCKLEVCTLEVHDDDQPHGCEHCNEVKRKLAEAAYNTEVERADSRQQAGVYYKGGG